MLPTPLMTDPDRAWAPFEPDRDGPWDRPRAAHLHRRAGFAAPWEALGRDLHDGPTASIDRLLAGESTSVDGQPAAEFEASADAMSRGLGASGGLATLQASWLYRMILTPHPLRERLALFWHGHFATSDAKVNDLNLMAGQNALIRAHALGSFRALLDGMARDPAMLTWLDATSNRKAHPNENFAREVMELFTLGRGPYTEQDVREAARAYTGAFVSGEGYREVPSQHDEGSKTIFGRSGPFRGDDVARLLLDRPECAEFLARKLFRLFVSEVDAPSPALIAPLAGALRDADYDVKAPVGLILRSRLFHDPAMRRRRVKSPVEFAVGAIRALEITCPTVSATALAGACAKMGQGLYAPPSVAGWEGGPAWINTSATLARSNLALALASTTDREFGKRLDPSALASRRDGGADPAGFFAELLVQDALDEALRARVAALAKGDARAAIGLILTAPEFQLA